ncbi:MAG: membrane protein insertion efficiency factor YidD [Pseudomonadota bacterium]
MKYLLTKLIRGYQFLLSPWIGHQCRFHPSCSNYAIEAIDQHGAMRGSVLAVRRVSRCHPWHEGGVDLVPPATEHK